MSRVPRCALTLVLVGLALSPSAPAEEDARRPVAWGGMAPLLEATVQRFYPDAAATIHGPTIRIEHDARDYLVHHQSKRGEWQDAVVERGPRSRGVVLDAELVPGPYRSQLATGVFDERTYVEHRYVVYDEALEHHLNVVLRLPGRARHPVPEDFVEALGAVIRRFADHVARARGGDRAR